MFVRKLEKFLEEFINEFINERTISEYRCQDCNGIVSRDTKQCPHCGVWLAAIVCLNCGFQGQEEDFVDDICPKCGDLVLQQQQPKGCLPLLFSFFKRDLRTKEEKQRDRELERLFGTYAQIPEDRRRKKNSKGN